MNIVVFLAVAAVPADFSVFALLFALGAAAAFLTMGNFVYNRFGF